MDDTLDIYPGVRAEPRFLRDPTSLETISSGLSRLSTFVTSNLPKRKQAFSTPFSAELHKQPVVCSPESVAEDDGPNGQDSITYATFQKIELDPATNRLCLLLCYQDGFQVWDVTNPDNVHELCSVKDKDTFSTVVHIHAIKNPQPSHDDAVDAFAQDRPLLAVVSTLHSPIHDDNLTTSNNNQPRDISTPSLQSTPTRVNLYSLKSHRIVKEIYPFADDGEDAHIRDIQSNRRVIVLGCTSHSRSTLYTLSSLNLERFSAPLTDVYHDASRGPVFTLGSRFLAYATSTPILNADPNMGSLTKGAGSMGFGVLQGNRDMKGAAKEIAKEVVSGVKTLSGFGYHKLSNYFSAAHEKTLPDAYMKSTVTTTVPRRASTGMNTGRKADDRVIFPITPPSLPSSKKLTPRGMIMVRDIFKLPANSTRNILSSTVAHFKPHVNSISKLVFNSAGTLLMSASKSGHTFHLFAIIPSSTHVGNATHLYSLSRGYTDAQVVDCQFSVDSTWCAVTTARGTTHVYAINPYGSKPDIIGHVRGKVNNPAARAFANHDSEQALTLNRVTLIKQRREVPVDVTDSEQTSPLNYMSGELCANQGYFGPTPPTYPSFLTAQRRRQVYANLATTFVSTARFPFLGSNDNYASLSSKSQIRGNMTSSVVASKNTSFASLKQQATLSVGNVLTTLGSTSIGPYLPVQSPWITATDKTNDNRMFGFDEEEQASWEDDVAKIIHDEIGYQDLYSFHPNGILTLHRCWATKSIVKRREYNRTLENLELTVKEEDLAEWHVTRAAKWEEVKEPFTYVDAGNVDEPESKKTWLSSAEITTYANVQKPPLWTNSQIIFQTFTQAQWQEAVASKGKKLPDTETVVVRRDIPEPYSSRINRVGKTVARTSKNLKEEDLDDALVELEDNLSNAMQTTFPPASSFDGSPGGTKRLSSLMDTLSGSYFPGRSPMDRISSLSFEDAYLISMGGGGVGPSQVPPMEHEFLIQFDDPAANEEVLLARSAETSEETSGSVEEEDQGEDFTPDGDNEVAYPSGSFLAEQVFEF